MAQNLAAFMVKMLEEQAALIQKQKEMLQLFASNAEASIASESLSAVAAEEKDGKKKPKKVKDPNRPKRSLSGYQLFMADHNADCKAANPDKDATVIMTLVAHQWAAADEHTKRSYNEKADELRKQYMVDIAAYEAANPDKAKPPPKAKKSSASSSSSSSNSSSSSSSSGGGLCRVHWVEECGHVPHLEKPTETAKVIHQFLLE
mmetsp:Transcript_26312/g.43925  ORF Transcript_26312/g.43925 Transcript_26312/m.43925 type:complete len:204 (+) Transcript_26312:62-673(+)